MTTEQSARYRAIREKRNILRDRYGGLMTLTQLSEEIGYKDVRFAKKWAQEVQLECVQIGRSVRYDTDHLAKILVDRRVVA